LPSLADLEITEARDADDLRGRRCPGSHGRRRPRRRGKLADDEGAGVGAGIEIARDEVEGRVVVRERQAAVDERPVAVHAPEPIDGRSARVRMVAWSG